MLPEKQRKGSSMKKLLGWCKRFMLVNPPKPDPPEYGLLSHMVRGSDGQMLYNPELYDVFDIQCAVCLKETQHMNLPHLQLQICRDCRVLKYMPGSISSDYIDKFNPEIKTEGVK